MSTLSQRSIRGVVLAVVALALMLAVARRDALALLGGDTFVAGDVFVSLHSGQVQWRHSDGSLAGTLGNTIPGKAEGMAFDAAANLYVTHHCADSFCLSGNGVERFNSSGVSIGAFGTGYNCNPNSIVFGADGHGYVGQADCSGDVLEFDAAGTSQGSFDVTAEARGSSWVDLAADGCTLFYTSMSPKVKRFNVCAGSQSPDFALLPDTGYGLRVLPDGGLLVADNSSILRLDSAGTVIQVYDVPGEPDLWLSLDIVGDGTFWASNYGSSNVHRFNLATGAVVASFNTGTPAFTVKGVAVKRAPSVVASRGRMTGGGSVFTAGGMRVTHGFELHCDASRKPNNLEVNWQGNKFHLGDLTFAECTDDPTINPVPPQAPFDTYRGRGTGRYNNQNGATAEWTFTDAGEPGRGDRATITVRDTTGNIVLEVSNYLTYGNHQAHK